MSESIFIATDGRAAKTKSVNVAKRISDASTDINNAKKELNNVDYVDLSYEIDQLESMYKKNNNQASEFETFASTLESMVNDYISVDKECATRIKSNGKNHRKNTGLAKNLALATICASFDKVGNKLGDIADNVKDWAESVVDWFKTSLEEDWDSYIQGIGAFIQMVSSGIIIAGCLVAAMTGIAAPVSLPIAGAAAVAFITGLDKLWGAIADIMNYKETDGKSNSQFWAEEKGAEWYSKIFGVVDFGASISTGTSMISKIFTSKNIVNIYYMMDRLGRLDDISKIANLVKGLGIASNVSTGVDVVVDISKKDSEGIFDKIKNSIIENIVSGLI